MTSSAGPRIALTFDAEHPDRPRCAPGVQEAILDVLRDHGVRATFFLQGRWVEAYPATARRVTRDGHLVGSHSFYHARMPLLTDRGIVADVGDAERAVRELAEADPRPWFRCPFGDGHRDPRVVKALAELGYRDVHWDVAANDWEPERTADAVADAAVVGALEHGDGAVVLLHTWPEPTLEALPGIIRRLRDGGASFATVGEVLP